MSVLSRQWTIMPLLSTLNAYVECETRTPLSILTRTSVIWHRVHSRHLAHNQIALYNYHHHTLLQTTIFNHHFICSIVIPPHQTALQLLPSSHHNIPNSTEFSKNVTLTPSNLRTLRHSTQRHPRRI